MKFDSFPIFRWHKEPWFGFRSPDFEPELNNMLKSIPLRAWCPLEKTWWYPAQYFPVVEATAAPYFAREMQGGFWVDFVKSAPVRVSESRSNNEISQLREKIRVLCNQIERGQCDERIKQTAKQVHASVIRDMGSRQ